jgi:hypothetical protein
MKNKGSVVTETVKPEIFGTVAFDEEVIRCGERNFQVEEPEKHGAISANRGALEGHPRKRLVLERQVGSITFCGSIHYTLVHLAQSLEEFDWAELRSLREDSSWLGPLWWGVLLPCLLDTIRTVAFLVVNKSTWDSGVHDCATASA